jgi:hypothetical protein
VRRGRVAVRAKIDCPMRNHSGVLILSQPVPSWGFVFTSRVVKRSAARPSPTSGAARSNTSATASFDKCAGINRGRADENGVIRLSLDLVAHHSGRVVLGHVIGIIDCVIECLELASQSRQAAT